MWESSLLLYYTYAVGFKYIAILSNQCDENVKFEFSDKSLN